MTLSHIISGILSNRCPKCDSGQVFRTLIKMNEKCPQCHVKFEREPGYFVGAMSFSYIIGFIAILPTFLSLLWKTTSLFTMVAWPSIELLILAPFLFRYSR